MTFKGFRKPKSNQENPPVFISPFGQITPPNRTTTVVSRIHIAGRLTYFQFILVTAIGGRPMLEICVLLGRLRCSRYERPNLISQ